MDLPLGGCAAGTHAIWLVDMISKFESISSYKHNVLQWLPVSEQVEFTIQWETGSASFGYTSTLACTLSTQCGSASGGSLCCTAQSTHTPACLISFTRNSAMLCCASCLRLAHLPLDQFCHLARNAIAHNHLLSTLETDLYHWIWESRGST